MRLIGVPEEQAESFILQRHSAVVGLFKLWLEKFYALIFLDEKNP